MHRSGDGRAVDLVDLLAVHEPGETFLGPKNTIGVELLGWLAAFEDLGARSVGAKVMLPLVVHVTCPSIKTVSTRALPEGEDGRQNLIVLGADRHVTGVPLVQVHANRGLKVTADLLVLRADAIGLDHVVTLDERDTQRLQLTRSHEGHRGGLAVSGPLGCV